MAEDGATVCPACKGPIDPDAQMSVILTIGDQQITICEPCGTALAVEMSKVEEAEVVLHYDDEDDEEYD